MLCWPENGWDNKVFDAGFKVTQTCFFFIRFFFVCLFFPTPSALSLTLFHFFVFVAFVLSGDSLCPRMSDVFMMYLRENFWVVACVIPHPKVEPVYRNEYLLSAYVAQGLYCMLQCMH